MSYFAEELYKLRQLSGAEFIVQLKVLTARSEFHPLVENHDIFTVGGETREDYTNLINAAFKAVEQGYRVYILPTPKGIRMADFILERKGVYKLFDLKSISGKSSASNRLMESIGQTNHVMLNMLTDYDARQFTNMMKIPIGDIPNYVEKARSDGSMVERPNRVIHSESIELYNIAIKNNTLPISRKGNWVQEYKNLEDVMLHVEAQFKDVERIKKLINEHE